METSTIILPDHIKQLADTRAVSHGFSGAAEYVQSLILADAADPIDAALEAHLLKAMEEPGIEMTEADWKLRGERLADKYGGAQP